MDTGKDKFLEKLGRRRFIYVLLLFTDSIIFSFYLSIYYFPQSIYYFSVNGKIEHSIFNRTREIRYNFSK